MNKLLRNEVDGTIGGVCAGLSDTFNTDVSIIKLLFCLGALFSGLSIIVYILFWIIVPSKN